MKINQFFEDHTFFRYEEFAEYMQAKGITRPGSWRQQLNYHLKAGHLIHIRKYLYAVKPIFSKEVFVDPYLIASKATPDAVLAYHTALELHGIAYSTFSELTVISSRTSPSFTYEGIRFRAIKKSQEFLDADNSTYGIEIIQRNGMNLKVTSLERTLVDILDRPDLSGGWEEISRSLENITRIDIRKIVEYTLLLKNSTTSAKVGFFLEQLPAHLSLDKNHLKNLLPHIPKQAHYLNRDERKGGKYFEKWRLIVPESIVNRSWEEPDVENI
jgi:predicted transcriptional regulator of viral defense system